MLSLLSIGMKVLDNGLKLLVREDHTAPVVTCWLAYRVGSRNERPGITGISHFVEHMLFRGVGRFKDEIDRLVSSRGGHLNAFTSEDATIYYETLPSNSLRLALEVEAERMSNAVFNEEVVEKERGVILSEREMAENYPQYQLWELVRATALIAHPYRWPVVGWKSDIESITVDDLKEYYRTYYRPSNAVLVVVGDVDAGKVLEEVEELFGSVGDGARPPEPRTREPPQRGERRVELRMPGEVSYVYVAYRAPNASSEDLAPFLVMDAILAGAKSFNPLSGASFTRSSKLYRELVREGYASSASSQFTLTIDPFLYVLSLTVKSGVKPEEAEERLLKVVEGLDVSEEDIKRAVSQVEAQLVYSVENVTGQGLMMSRLEVVASVKRFEELLSEVRRVSPADVRRVVADYLVEDKRTVGVFRPEEVGA
ncbi:MAG: insulinase family protein [Thermoprotei archaeon]|nr:MAG: insulinase family protein [Thermoprotei archaeon]